MKFKELVTFLIIIILIMGCKNKDNDALKFKQEYESFNKSNIKLDIDEDNIMKYSTVNEINKLIKDGTGVIFIGSPKDNLSRASINVLLDASDSTDLNTIYYINSINNIKLEGIDNPKLPLVINVLDGKIKSYHIGTINDKHKLTEDEELELYNIYTDGIHEVLGDTCDEEC